MDYFVAGRAQETPGKRLGSIDIVQLLRREINSGALETGSRLPPGRELAKTYGVARGTLREALKQLAQEDLVEIRPGSGTYVALMKPQKFSTVIQEASPLELIDARFALEPHICRLAVLHGRQQDLDLGDELLAAMSANPVDAIAFSIASRPTIAISISVTPTLISFTKASPPISAIFAPLVINLISSFDFIILSFIKSFEISLKTEKAKIDPILSLMSNVK